MFCKVKYTQRTCVHGRIHPRFHHVSLLSCLNQDVCKVHRFRGTKETTAIPAGSSTQQISLRSGGERGPSEEGRVVLVANSVS